MMILLNYFHIVPIVSQSMQGVDGLSMAEPGVQSFDSRGSFQGSVLNTFPAPWHASHGRLRNISIPAFSHNLRKLTVIDSNCAPKTLSILAIVWLILCTSCCRYWIRWASVSLIM